MTLKSAHLCSCFISCITLYVLLAVRGARLPLGLDAKLFTAVLATRGNTVDDHHTAPGAARARPEREKPEAMSTDAKEHVQLVQADGQVLYHVSCMQCAAVCAASERLQPAVQPAVQGSCGVGFTCGALCPVAR